MGAVPAPVPCSAGRVRSRDRTTRTPASAAANCTMPPSPRRQRSPSDSGCSLTSCAPRSAPCPFSGSFLWLGKLVTLCHRATYARPPDKVRTLLAWRGSRVITVASATVCNAHNAISRGSILNRHHATHWQPDTSSQSAEPVARSALWAFEERLYYASDVSILRCRHVL